VKITHLWLREFVAVEGSAADLAAQLTLAGLEVESVAAVAPAFSAVIVGEVLDTARHPNAEKLWVCQVTTDGSDRLQIVCGADNVRPGLKVAVAMVGARLPDGITIKRAKLRGLESQGMLCSARELGLGSDHDGILELPPSFTLGRDVRDALELDDRVLDVKTLNRGDCMSVFGIARDYAAAQHRRYLDYGAPRVAAASDAVFPVRIAVPAACPAFSARVIKDVRPGLTSPLWLRERLRRVGINSISAVVDVTNYVMMELGQPLHAYDLERLHGGLTVRWAAAGERLTLLDEQEHRLEADILVIADGTGAVGVAGVMGGRDSAISAATTSVLFEAAHFAPAAIAGRSRRLGLVTDAAQRFERGVDPTLPARAIERATELLLGIAGGVAGPVVTTVAAPSGEPEFVTLRGARLARLLGVTVPEAEVHAVLGAISPQLDVTADGWRVRTPPHRFDLRIEADLIEEVARLRGFDRIAESHALAPQLAGDAAESAVPTERVLAAMIDRGYREAITYSFVDPALQRQLFPGVPTLVIANPISVELSEMRVSLWPGLLQAARENLRRQQSRVRLFEVGKQFQLHGSELSEIEMLAAVVTGTRVPEQWDSAKEAADFFDVKADALAILALAADLDSVRFEASTLGCLRPGRTARIYRGQTPLGWIGELHPQLARALGLASAPLLLELDISLSFVSKPPIFQKISRFPSVRRDLAVVVDESVSLAVLRENVNVSASGLLSELRIFDVYRGSSIDLGRKSIALGLILQDSSRTLTDDDADAVVAAVVARLRDVLSATIRDQ
jgi:phenylalanyl-tRNA synthetase beta chain